MYYDEPEIEPVPTPLESGIMSLIKAEVDEQIGHFKQELEWYKEQHELMHVKNIKLTKDYSKLKQQLGNSQDFETFKSLINEKNIGQIIKHFNLKSINFSFDGMYSDCIPDWFKLIVTYYPDKETLISLFDLFEIKYPSWIKKFRLPFDYNEEELDLIFSKLGKVSMTNGCNFDNNAGFYFREFNMYKADLKYIFQKESYVSIPWNLLLQNKLLTTEKYFDKIIESIKNKESHSAYFYKIQSYQEIDDEQVKRMLAFLPTKGLYDVHKAFISNNRNILRVMPELAATFEDQIQDNQFSAFYYLNYPLEMQKEFVRKSNSRYLSKFDLVKRMEISKEEKIEFLNEINEIMLDETK